MPGLVDYSGVFEIVPPNTTIDGSGRSKIVVQLHRRRKVQATPAAIELADLTLKMRLDLYGDGTPAACGADATVWVLSGVNDGKRLRANLLLDRQAARRDFSSLDDKQLM